jgi:membrane protein DedA with SNARE-associated domain
MDPLSSLIEWISLYGLIGLLALGIFERFVPIVPSYGVLVAIGIAADERVWSLYTAVFGSVAGSLFGSLALYWLTLHLSEERVHRMLLWVGRMTGISAPRIDRSIVLFREHQRGLSFGMQLVPSIRLISPIIAGMFRADGRAFAIATLLGIPMSAWKPMRPHWRCRWSWCCSWSSWGWHCSGAGTTSAPAATEIGTDACLRPGRTAPCIQIIPLWLILSGVPVSPHIPWGYFLQHPRGVTIQ